MAEQIVGMTPQAFRRTRNAVLWAEGQRRSGQAEGETIFSPANIQFVVLKSTTKDGSDYPGRVVLHDAPTNTWLIAGNVWVRPANPTAVLRTKVKYPARQSGERDDGRSVFVVFDACCTPEPDAPPTQTLTCGGHTSHAIPEVLWLFEASFPCSYTPYVYDAAGPRGSGWYTEDDARGIYCDTGATSLKVVSSSLTVYGDVSLDCTNYFTGPDTHPGSTDCAEVRFRIIGLTGLTHVPQFVLLDESLQYLSLISPVPEAIAITIVDVDGTLGGTRLLLFKHSPTLYGYDSIPEYTRTFTVGGRDFALACTLYEDLSTTEVQASVTLVRVSDSTLINSAPAISPAPDWDDDLPVEFTSGVTDAQSFARAWEANTAYAVGTKIRGTGLSTHLLQVTTAGTSGLVEPTWTLPGPITDGTVTWIFASASRNVEIRVDYGA